MENPYPIGHDEFGEVKIMGNEDISREIKKVYCKNCKWLIGTLYCEQKRLSEGISLARAELKDVSVFYLNQYRDCPFYKRQWWKIVIRRKK